MQLQRFFYYHQDLYARLLKLGLVLTLTAGLSSTSYQLAMAGNHMSPPPATPRAVRSTSNSASVAQPPMPMIASPAPVAIPAVAQLPPAVSLSAAVTDPKTLARRISAARFGDAHWPALEALWARESGWNPAARNAASGACGIPQALPCRKIPDMSPRGQIEWGINYIANRYGNPTNAWRHWQAHRWY